MGRVEEIKALYGDLQKVKNGLRTAASNFSTACEGIVKSIDSHIPLVTNLLAEAGKAPAQPALADIAAQAKNLAAKIDSVVKGE